MRNSIIVGLVLTAATAAAGTSQRFITGIFTASESGAPIELIAWAETSRAGVFSMANGSLEDAPILPRTYRMLVNMGSYDIIGVLAVTTEVFKKPLDRLAHENLKFSRVMLGVSTFEIGVPLLEDWEKVQRLRRNLKGTIDNPVVYFLIITNGANVRYYPFFIDRT